MPRFLKFQLALKGIVMNKISRLVLLCVLPTLLFAQQEQTSQQKFFASVQDTLTDVKSIDAILHALYDVISGPAGQQRDWNRFRSFFVPGARLIVARSQQNDGAKADLRDIEGYIQAASPYFEKNGFYESEIARRIDAFGNIAHIFSTYESRHKADDPAPFSRGINSIQLLKDGNRWWIVTIYWDSERPGNPIPEMYLPEKKK
jgi:hypothetical protein